MKRRFEFISLIIILICSFLVNEEISGSIFKHQDFTLNKIDADQEFCYNNPIVLECSYRDIVVYGNYSFIIPNFSDYWVPILILNNTNPRKPTQISLNNYSVFNDVLKIEIFENYLVILKTSNWGILEFYDAAKPAILPFIGLINCTKYGYITDYIIRDKILTILMGNETNENNYKITILSYDLSVIETPTLLLNCSFTNIFCYTKLQTDTNRMYLLSANESSVQSNNLTILEYENETHANIIKNIEMTQVIKTIDFHNDYLFLISKEDKLMILNLSDLQTVPNPKTIFSHSSLKEVTIFNNVAYLLAYDSIFIFDLSDMMNIELLSEYETKVQGFGFFNDFFISTNFIYAIRTAEYLERGYFIIDVNNLEKPRKLYPTSFVFSSETRFYLGVVFSGIGIIGLPLALIITITILIIRKKRKRKANAGDIQ